MDSIGFKTGDLASYVPPAGDIEPFVEAGDDLIERLSSPEMGKASLSEHGDASGSALTIGLIDSYRFSRECLSNALTDSQPNATIIPFDTAENCVANKRATLDLVIFYSHGGGASDAVALEKIAAVAKLLPNIPLVVLSDAEDAEQLKTVCSTLKCGAQGIISTRTTGMSIAAAAIRLVKAGGIFAPTDMLLPDRPKPAPALLAATRQSRLTSRQMSVLSHVQRGHANKTIAHQLSMSESTVKVHVRNIMRKLGATNRTQAVYKAREMWDGAAAVNGADA